MISVWWTLVAFIGGGCAGVMLMALMRFAGDLAEQSETLPRGLAGDDPVRLPDGKETFCSFSCRDRFVDASQLSQANNEPRQFECQYFERSGQQMS
jgi:hypothetical protein